MILRCSCYNSAADAKYGQGIRPHTRLNTDEYMCELCYFVRTEAQGRRTGEKKTCTQVALLNMQLRKAA